MLKTVTVKMTRTEWLRYCEWLVDRENGPAPVQVGDHSTEQIGTEDLIPEVILEEPEDTATGIGRPANIHSRLHCSRCGAPDRRRAIHRAPYDGRCYDCRDIPDSDLQQSTVLVTPRAAPDNPVTVKLLTTKGKLTKAEKKDRNRAKNAQKRKAVKRKSKKRKK